jgi:hypothetical protein
MGIRRTIKILRYTGCNPSGWKRLSPGEVGSEPDLSGATAADPGFHADSICFSEVVSCYAEHCRRGAVNDVEFVIADEDLIRPPAANEIWVAWPESVAASKETSWPVMSPSALRRKRAAREVLTAIFATTNAIAARITRAKCRHM